MATGDNLLAWPCLTYLAHLHVVYQCLQVVSDSPTSYVDWKILRWKKRKSKLNSVWFFWEEDLFNILYLVFSWFKCVLQDHCPYYPLWSLELRSLTKYIWNEIFFEELVNPKKLIALWTLSWWFEFWYRQQFGNLRKTFDEDVLSSSPTVEDIHRIH